MFTYNLEIKFPNELSFIDNIIIYYSGGVWKVARHFMESVGSLMKK